MPSDTLHPTRRNAGETKFCLYYAGNTCSQKEVFPLLLLISGQSREGRFERSQQQSKSFSIGTDSLALSVLMGPRCLRNSTGQLRPGESVGGDKTQKRPPPTESEASVSKLTQAGDTGRRRPARRSPSRAGAEGTVHPTGGWVDQCRSAVRPFSIAPCSVRCINAERETAERGGDAVGRLLRLGLRRAVQRLEGQRTKFQFVETQRLGQVVERGPERGLYVFHRASVEPVRDHGRGGGIRPEHKHEKEEGPGRGHGRGKRLYKRSVGRSLHFDCAL